MAKQREVRILIGKRTYLMQTELDDDTLKRVVGTVNEVCGAIGKNVDQDNMLVLTCLHLAYNIEKISKRLKFIDRKLSDMKLYIETEEEDK